MSSEIPITFIEVCAGAGGLSSGLIDAGFTPLLLNDNNKDCCETLRRNHQGANVVCKSMDELDVSAFIGRVDLLCGGVPCQSFSQAGQRRGLEDPRGKLMLKFADMIRLLLPKMFMIENVKGLVTHDGGNTIQSVVDTLNIDGLYDVTYKVLNASDYRVPQKRERVFIIGLKKDQQIHFEFPNTIPNKVILRDILSNVPISPCAKYSQEKIDLFRMIPQGGCWVNLPENLQRQYLGNSYYSGGGKRGILYRLSMDKQSLTLLCTPSQKQTERCHPLEERPLSIREYARIQTFPDEYEFVGSITSQYKQIGNAVPVELARHVGKSLFDAIKNSE